MIQIQASSTQTARRGGKQQGEGGGVRRELVLLFEKSKHLRMNDSNRITGLPQSNSLIRGTTDNCTNKNSGFKVKDIKQGGGKSKGGEWKSLAPHSKRHRESEKKAEKRKTQQHECSPITLPVGAWRLGGEKVERGGRQVERERLGGES